MKKQFCEKIKFMRFFLTGLILLVLISNCDAQALPDTNTLQSIKVSGIRTIRGIGHLPPVKDGIIYAGMKNEDIKAIYAYLRTVAPIRNVVEKFPK